MNFIPLGGEGFVRSDNTHQVNLQAPFLGPSYHVLFSLMCPATKEYGRNYAIGLDAKAANLRMGDDTFPFQFFLRRKWVST